jgi:hypothetical protein
LITIENSGVGLLNFSEITSIAREIRLAVLVTLRHNRHKSHHVKELRKFSLHPKSLECFDWNTNIKESVSKFAKLPN